MYPQELAMLLRGTEEVIYKKDDVIINVPTQLSILMMA
jgi:CRP-like cAMP-binding protein